MSEDGAMEGDAGQGPVAGPGLEAGPHREQPFTAPWQAQVFAMTVTLHERGLFTWPEWAQVLSRHLVGGADDGSDYYERWADALQEMLAERGVVTAGDVATTTEAWHAAAARTPHGQPIAL